MNKAAYSLSVWLAENQLRKKIFAESVGIKSYALSRLLHGVSKPDGDLAAKIERKTKGTDQSLRKAHEAL